MVKGKKKSEPVHNEIKSPIEKSSLGIISDSDEIDQLNECQVSNQVSCKKNPAKNHHSNDILV